MHLPSHPTTRQTSTHIGTKELEPFGWKATASGPITKSGIDLSVDKYTGHVLGMV